MNCFCVVVVSCRFNTINHVTQTSLAGLRKLELLMMHGNDLHNFANGVFKDLMSLQVQIKCYLSYAPNTTGVGRPYSEMLSYKPWTNDAVLRKISVK